MTAFEDFVSLELPRRDTTLTSARTGGFTGNPNVAVNGTLNNAPIGTWFIDTDGANEIWRKRGATSTDWQREDITFIADGGDAITTIFARSTGSDATGDGTSVGTAYRTLRRALRDVPQTVNNEQYIVDCTGIGTESSVDPLIPAPRLSADGFLINFTPTVPGGFIEGPVTVNAVPTVVATVPVADRTGSTAQATTSLLTYNTTADLGLADSQQGRFIYGLVGAFGPTGIIAGNTAGPSSDIRTTARFEIDTGTDLVIAEPSAVISTTGTDDAFILRNQACLFVMQGIGFETSASNTRGIAVLSGNTQVSFNFCETDGVRWIDPGYLPTMNDVFLRDKKCFFHGNSPQLARCFFLNSSPDIRLAGLTGGDAMRFTQCIIDGGDAVGASGIDRHNTWNVTLDRCEILNMTADGLFCPRGGVYEIEQTQIHDCGGDAIQTQGGKGVTNNVDSSVGGANGGVGQRLLDGAQVSSLTSTSVSGTGGDYVCGGNAVGTYPIPGGSEDDLAAATPQLCRIYN